MFWRCVLGVRAAGGGQHVGQATHNKLLDAGAANVLRESSPPIHATQPAAPRPYGVDGVTRDGLVGWALASDDIEAALGVGAKGFDLRRQIRGHKVTTTRRLGSASRVHQQRPDRRPGPVSHHVGRDRRAVRCLGAARPGA